MSTLYFWLIWCYFNGQNMIFFFSKTRTFLSDPKLLNGSVCHRQAKLHRVEAGMPRLAWLRRGQVVLLMEKPSAQSQREKETMKRRKSSWSRVISRAGPSSGGWVIVTKLSVPECCGVSSGLAPWPSLGGWLHYAAAVLVCEGDGVAQTQPLTGLMMDASGSGSASDHPGYTGRRREREKPGPW